MYPEFMDFHERSPVWLRQSLEEFVKLFMDPRTVQESIVEIRLGIKYLQERTEFSENNFNIWEDVPDKNGDILLHISENDKDIIPIYVNFDEMLDLI